MPDLLKFNPRTMLKIIFFWGVMCFSIFSANAQRIYGAEMYKETLGDAEVEVRVWREFGSNPFIMFDWGDGTPLDTLFLQSTIPPFPTVYRIDRYRGVHHYDTVGYYRIGFRDSFLIENIVNIEDSGNRSLALFDTIGIFPAEIPVLQLNTSPRFFWQQGHLALLDGKVVFYNHTEGDFYFWSDIYEVYLEPFPSEGGYTLPAATDSISLPGGVLIWDRPVSPGRYAIGMNLREYRRGLGNVWPVDTVLLTTTMRAMTMFIDESFIVSSTHPDVFQGLISLYPNPATDLLHLQLGGFHAPVQVRIFDALGREVYETQVAAASQVETLRIPVAAWPQGVYNVQIVSEGKVLTRQVAVQR